LLIVVGTQRNITSTASASRSSSARALAAPMMKDSRPAPTPSVTSSARPSSPDADLARPQALDLLLIDIGTEHAVPEGVTREVSVTDEKYYLVGGLL